MSKDQLHHYRSIDAYVLLSDPKQELRSAKEVLEEARMYAEWLKGETIEGIPVDYAEPMTLEQYIPVIREAMTPPEIDAQDNLDHLFARSRDPFYLFAANQNIVLDTQIEILQKRSRKYKIFGERTGNFRVNITNHGIPWQKDISFPAPLWAKCSDGWTSGWCRFTQRRLAQDIIIEVEDPTDFTADHIKALTVHATQPDTFPKYSFINAQGAYTKPPRIRNTTGFIAGEQLSTVPIIVYTKEPSPYYEAPESTPTADMQRRFTRAIEKASQEMIKFCQGL